MFEIPDKYKLPAFCAFVLFALLTGGLVMGGSARDSGPICDFTEVVRILERQTDVLTDILVSVKMQEMVASEGALAQGGM